MLSVCDRYLVIIVQILVIYNRESRGYHVNNSVRKILLRGYICCHVVMREGSVRSMMMMVMMTGNALRSHYVFDALYKSISTRIDVSHDTVGIDLWHMSTVSVTMTMMLVVPAVQQSSLSQLMGMTDGHLPDRCMFMNTSDITMNMNGCIDVEVKMNATDNHNIDIHCPPRTLSSLSDILDVNDVNRSNNMTEIMMSRCVHANDCITVTSRIADVGQQVDIDVVLEVC